MSGNSSLAEFVFGYGSLLRRDGSTRHLRPVPARLDGFRRTWDVAMDNSIDLPGYKYYRDPDGSRPTVFVTFLNLIRTVEHAVNGSLFEVSHEDLAELDARERNYERVEITGQLLDAPRGRVWTYIGTAAARRRHRSGLVTGAAAVSRAYHDDVLKGFAALGVDALAEYEATTDPPACPIRELERVDLRD